jgi:hypothetical protein
MEYFRYFEKNIFSSGRFPRRSWTLIISSLVGNCWVREKHNCFGIIYECTK